MTMTNDCVDLRRPGRPVGKVPPCVLVLVAPSVFGQEAATPCPDCLGAGLQICLPFPEGESVCSEGSCVHVKSPIFCLELCFRKRDLAAKIQKGSDLWDSATCFLEGNSAIISLGYREVPVVKGRHLICGEVLNQRKQATRILPVGLRADEAWHLWEGPWSPA